MMEKQKKPIRFVIGIIGALFAFSFVLFACSQPDNRVDTGYAKLGGEYDDSTYTEVEVMPQFPGGMDSLTAYLSTSITYPSTAKSEGIEGKVVVNFIISKDGSVRDVNAIKGIGYGCDEEAMRVISQMPDWTLGLINGKAVKVSFNIPIQFNLDHSVVKDSVFKVVEIMPEFPGGVKALMQYLGSNIKYPEQAKHDSIQGKVFVQFVVEKDGTVSGTKVLRGIGGGCDEEALRVVSSMPNWNPGLDENNEPVRVQYNIPIKYALK